MLDDWVAAVSEELGLEVEVDIRRLLDVARVAAHNVDRPAAPLTTFLLGYAAGRHGAVDPALYDRVSALAERWQEERPA